MIEGAIKYTGDGEFYMYEVEGNRVTWCHRIGADQPTEPGLRLHQEILDDARHQEDKRA